MVRSRTARSSGALELLVSAQRGYMRLQGSILNKLLTAHAWNVDSFSAIQSSMLAASCAGTPLPQARGKRLFSSDHGNNPSKPPGHEIFKMGSAASQNVNNLSPYWAQIHIGPK